MPEAYQWTRVLHIFAFLLWVGTQMSLMNTLIAAGRCQGTDRRPLVDLARKTAMIMDIGALLAIASGLVLALAWVNWFATGGWLHAKLTVVVLLLVTHVLMRIKVGKYRRGGDPSPMPGILYPVLNLLVIAIIVLAVVRPF